MSRHSAGSSPPSQAAPTHPEGASSRAADQIVPPSDLTEPSATFGAFEGASLLTCIGNGPSREYMVSDIDEEGSLLQSLLSGVKREETFNPDWDLRILACWDERPLNQGLLPLPLSQGVYRQFAAELAIPDDFEDVLDSGTATVLESPRLEFSQRQSHMRPEQSFIVQLNATGVFRFSAAIAIWPKWRCIRALVFGAKKDAGTAWLSEVGRTSLPIHWTTLPVVVMQVFCIFWTRAMSDLHGSIWRAEHATGMRDWLDPAAPVGEQVDLTEVTRALNSDIASAANYILQFAAANIVLKRLEGSLQEEIKDKGGAPDLRHITSYISYLITCYHGKQEKATYLKERASAQMQTVFSMVAQRDSQTNVEIAEASKKLTELSREDNLRMMQIAEDSRSVAVATAKDSAAMRIIAAMTMIFLPATTVATLFSTSFFDFHPVPGDRVSSWIWLYTAVTAALTVVILGSWRITSRQKLKSIEKGRISAS